MSVDNSTANPGPMGWGEERDPIQQIVYNEKKHYEMLVEAQPLMSVAREPKPANQVLLAKMKSSMQADGIEDGFSCLHIEEVIFEFWLDWLAQIIGSCVESGFLRGASWRTMIEVFLLNDPEELFGTTIVGTNNIAHFGPYSYRAGRKIAGINRGDGSYCSAHIRGAKEYGMLPCSTPGIVSDAFPEPQSASLYRKYGNSDQILTDFGSVGRLYRLLESVKIDDAEFGKTQLVEGFKPFMVCSNWAFKPSHEHPTWKLRDGSPVWIYTRNRLDSWAHNMTIAAFVLVGGKWYVIVYNSWGKRAHKNGHWFVITFDEYADWVRSSEQMTIGEIDLKDNETPIAA